jgi:leader peptidase (prepilin peptidase)/N-methyltransferase
MTSFGIDGPLLAFSLAAFGLVFGSFVTALSYRAPRGERISHGRSRCPSCGHALGSRDLVPVLSWVIQGGACRYCRAKISWRYPAIEIATAALFVGAGFLARDFTHLFLLLAMTPLMVALAVIDLEHRRQPNVLLAALALLALAWRWAGDQAFLTGVAVAIAVCILGVLLDMAAKAATGRPGLGAGDTKLFALAALALPVDLFLLFALIAALLGIGLGGIWGWRNRSALFPFAPAILAAYWISLVGADSLMPGVMRLHST